MTLSTGTELSHYEITSQIGRGGMGEVYQAKDQKLGRDVAIKVLPEEFAKDADRVARFQREAKLLASLNHPNIAAIYGLEESDGINFLVMELVEGQTLDDKIKSGAIPVEEALKLALQITEALEAAHDKGVIHRDLKPANIKVTPDNKVKVLDFGLAKAFAGDSENINLSNSPTLSDAATQQGIILGTAAYMSPEQARGKPVDRRADIWALGVVLFEMLKRQPLFSGEDVSSTLARVLEREPDFSTLPPDLNPRIHLMLKRCLKKDPKDRYGVINDARVDIQEVLADPSGVLVKPLTAETQQKKLRPMLPWIAAALVIGAIVAGLAVWMLRTAEPKQVMRFDYHLPKGQQFNQIHNLRANMIAVSPDGSQIVYCTPKGMYLRSLMDDFGVRRIVGTENSPSSPCFSPDGKWIGYFSSSDMKLKKILIEGGTPVPLCDSQTVFGALWEADDTIIYGDLNHGIMQVSARGGSPTTLIQGSYVSPQILPGGKSIIFTDVSSGPTYKILAQSLDSDERKELFMGVVPQYLPTGHLVYGALESITSPILNLFAVPFNPKTLEPKGASIPVIHNAGPYAVSRSGTLVYLPETPEALNRILVWVDRNGKEEAIDAPARTYAYARLSPDNTKIALDIRDQENDIWILDLVRKTLPYRLTFNPGMNRGSVWTPDSERVAFSSERDGAENIYWQSAEGSGSPEPLTEYPDASILPQAFSPDGKQLLYGNTSGIQDISILTLDGSEEPRVLLGEKEYNEGNPQISPNGRWLAYESNESGSHQIWVRPFPDIDSGGRRQITTKGGTRPLWNPNGRELCYYVESEGAMMAVPVETEGSFTFGTPEELFNGNYLSPYRGTQYSVSEDGQRFLMIKSADPEEGSAAPNKINIIVNWIEELKQKVPVP
ncbi:MAG: serine/threonine-protein kinase [Acidobacteria bacterium]|nr:serine/threonine-protein kinase [Acidobacteriota bacterium]